MKFSILALMTLAATALAAPTNDNAVAGELDDGKLEAQCGGKNGKCSRPWKFRRKMIDTQAAKCNSHGDCCSNWCRAPLFQSKRCK